jgi:hypothetical protein
MKYARLKKIAMCRNGGFMNGLRNSRLVRVLVVALVVLGLSWTVLADSDCWCAQFVDLREDVPTRSGSVFLGIAANVALIGLTYYVVDYVSPLNGDWYKMGALVTGASNIGSSLTNLLLPTKRAIERDEDEIAASVLSEDLCAATLKGYASRVTMHRLLNSGIDMASGLAQIFLLSPYGTYATGEILDYVYLVTGAIDIIGGAINVLFSKAFERDVRDAQEACGY